MAGYWWPFFSPCWPPSASFVGSIEATGSGPVTVGPYLAVSSGSGGGGASNTFVSAVGDGSTNWIGVGLIVSAPAAPASPGAGQTAGTQQMPAANLPRNAASTAPIIVTSQAGRSRTAGPSSPGQTRQTSQSSQSRQSRRRPLAGPGKVTIIT